MPNRKSAVTENQLEEALKNVDDYDSDDSFVLFQDPGSSYKPSKDESDLRDDSQHYDKIRSKRCRYSV